MTAPSPAPAEDNLFEAAACGLMLARGSGEILAVNRILCHWLGRERDELLGGARFTDLLSMGGRVFYQTHLMPLLRMQGSVAEVKLELLHKDGSRLPVLLNATERRDPDGGPLLHLAFFVARDRHKYEQELLRERQRAEGLSAELAQAHEELRSALAQAEERARFAEQMMGIVSHDLRNPLNVIVMSTHLLRRAPLPPEFASALDRIGRSTARAEHLIGDLLDFARTRFGRLLSIRPGPAELHQVVADAVADLRLAHPGREIVHRTEGEGPCSLDANRIAQLIGNLVSNAAAYGDPQQAITVASAVGPAECSVAVHNHGPAIPAQALDTLFEPMVRGEQHGGRGVGLGLYIVRQIALAHGGDVQVSSSPQEGTRFRAHFPRGPAP